MRDMIRIIWRIELGDRSFWYDRNGTFTPLIRHLRTSPCRDLPMPHDQSVVGWLSACHNATSLLAWFSPEDIARLTGQGLLITNYRVSNARVFDTHVLFNPADVIARDEVPISALLGAGGLP